MPPCVLDIPTRLWYTGPFFPVSIPLGKFILLRYRPITSTASTRAATRRKASPSYTQSGRALPATTRWKSYTRYWAACSTGPCSSGRPRFRPSCHHHAVGPLQRSLVNLPSFDSPHPRHGSIVQWIGGFRGFCFARTRSQTPRGVVPAALKPLVRRAVRVQLPVAPVHQVPHPQAAAVGSLPIEIGEIDIGNPGRHLLPRLGWQGQPCGYGKQAFHGVSSTRFPAGWRWWRRRGHPWRRGAPYGWMRRGRTCRRIAPRLARTGRARPRWYRAMPPARACRGGC